MEVKKSNLGSEIEEHQLLGVLLLENKRDLKKQSKILAEAMAGEKLVKLRQWIPMKILQILLAYEAIFHISMHHIRQCSINM